MKKFALDLAFAILFIGIAHLIEYFFPIKQTSLYGSYWFGVGLAMAYTYSFLNKKIKINF